MSRFGTQVAQLCGLVGIQEAGGPLIWYDKAGTKIIEDDELNAGILEFLSEYEDDDRRTERTDH